MCLGPAALLINSIHQSAAAGVAAAGFHNASLYEALRPAIPPLVALLSDEEDKTRANAAGALGNLVRNSSVLCGELISAGALRALLDTALQPERPPSVAGGKGSAAGATGGGSDGGSPVKIALFSLGNMCAHKECREALVQQVRPDDAGWVVRDQACYTGVHLTMTVVVDVSMSTATPVLYIRRVTLHDQNCALVCWCPAVPLCCACRV